MLLRRLTTFNKFFSSSYAQKMHQAWLKDAKSVNEHWQQYFKEAPKVVMNKSSENESEKQQDLAVAAYLMIRYYKVRGHQLANLDPLNLKNYEEFGKIYVKNPLQLDLKQNKVLNDSDLDIPFKVPLNPLFSDHIGKFLGEKQQWTMREIEKRLRKIYCGKIGLQYMHLSNIDQIKWLMYQFENLSEKTFSRQQKLYNLQQLAKIEAFNAFLNDKLKTSKRFGVQGLDTVILGLNTLVEEAIENNIQYIGFGMAHRGRLNALVNVFKKPIQKIFAEFQENVEDYIGSWGNSGDVKYHLGVTTERLFKGKKARLSILPNPSHLETVNPVVMGHVRAVKDSLPSNHKSLAVLIHGDAALAGQGVVYQCLQMSYLQHNTVDGVIHIVANNQIGFTTTPAQARTGLYCTDVAKSIQAPIFHVNADEPDLVHQVMKIAVRYREKFNKDIFVDIIGYRRYGHNEQDQPAFTQPMMYQEIGKRKNIYKIYSQKLIQQKVVSESQVANLWQQQMSKISQAYSESIKQTFDLKKWAIPSYHRVVDFSKLGQIKKTAMTPQELRSLSEPLLSIPSDFHINHQIQKIYEARRKSLETGQQIDFATAESLAFGSLLREGFNVRLSGQDVQRGTFSHRHAVLVDQSNEKKYMPLRNLVKKGEQQRVQIENSFLSEYAELGFEYGYSITNPNTLTIWQAQFGDFANGAQIIIDNYLASGESKWGLQSGLVMNLPHGMDGQGPQHSSARVQRFLQLMGDSSNSLTKQLVTSHGYKPIKSNNLQVVYPSNASNLFHAYRRQLRRDYRKPLINIISKKLLKFKEASSNLIEFNEDRFTTVYDQSDDTINPKAVKKIIIVAGQSYYSALQKRNSLKLKDVAIIRIEQVAPFHYYRFLKVLQPYSQCRDFVWFQQEQRNSGPWNYLSSRIEFCLETLKKQGKIQGYNLSCVSRHNSASPAVGKKSKHDYEQAQILNDLFRV